MAWTGHKSNSRLKNLSKRYNSIINRGVIATVVTGFFPFKTIDRNRQQGEKLRLSTDWNYQIRKKTAEYAVISATCRTWFIPEGLFEIFTEFTVVYRCKDDIAQNELEKSMEKLLLPAGEQNALLVAQITDKMRGNPMVVSPKVTLQDKGMNLN